MPGRCARGADKPCLIKPVGTGELAHEVSPVIRFEYVVFLQKLIFTQSIT
jgi:hypothetical protein